MTLRLNKRLAGYFMGILDHVTGIARQLHWKAKCGNAERRAILKSLPKWLYQKKLTKVRDEIYNLTPRIYERFSPD